MNLVFEYLPEDLRELRKALRGDRQGAKKTSRRGHNVALVVIGIFGLYILFEKFRESSLASMAPHNISWRTVFFDLTPWLLLVAAVLYVGLRVVFPSDAVLRGKLKNQSLTSMTIDESGVRTSTGTIETAWKWNAFDRFIETEKGFFLRQTNTVIFIIVPKRAISDPAMTDEIRQLFQSHIQPPTGAFAVIPLSP